MKWIDEANLYPKSQRYKKYENSKDVEIIDKTRTASLLNGYKNEPFRKFIDVNILKIDLVWAVKSSRKYIENGKRALSHIIKDIIKHVFILFYLHELLMSLNNNLVCTPTKLDLR